MKSADRLRECLHALAEHSGTDVLRIQFVVKANGSATIVCTHSRSPEAERYAVKLMVDWLHAMQSRPDPDAKIEDIDDDGTGDDVGGGGDG
jgi:hypothetical protein